MTRLVSKDSSEVIESPFSWFFNICQWMIKFQKTNLHHIFLYLYHVIPQNDTTIFHPMQVRQLPVHPIKFVQWPIRSMTSLPLYQFGFSLDLGLGVDMALALGLSLGQLVHWAKCPAGPNSPSAKLVILQTRLGKLALVKLTLGERSYSHLYVSWIVSLSKTMFLLNSSSFCTKWVRIHIRILYLTLTFL